MEAPPDLEVLELNFSSIRYQKSNSIKQNKNFL